MALRFRVLAALRDEAQRAGVAPEDFHAPEGEGGLSAFIHRALADESLTPGQIRKNVLLPMIEVGWLERPTLAGRTFRVSAKAPTTSQMLAELGRQLASGQNQRLNSHQLGARVKRLVAVLQQLAQFAARLAKTPADRAEFRKILHELPDSLGARDAVSLLLAVIDGSDQSATPQ